MDQFIEVTRNPSSEGVHHEIHPFFHHLHLRDYLRGNYIRSCRTAGILSLLPTCGMTAFWPLLVPSFCVCSFLVFLLSVLLRVLLAQLFLQVMILFGEAFYCCCEGLNLSFQGRGAQFVALIIGGCCHRTSKYHATFCPGSDKYGLSQQRVSHRQRQLMMPRNHQ